jgi:hypothetical protein
MGIQPQPFRAGQRLKAADLQWLLDEIVRLGKMSATPPLFVDSGPSGVDYRLAIPQRYDIKLTGGGTGGKYAWTRQVPTATGTWTADSSGEVGTTTVDPAYEYNLNTTVNLSPNPVVSAWREPGSNVLWFEGGSC